MKKLLLTFSLLLVANFTYSQTDEEGFSYVTESTDGNKYYVRLEKLGDYSKECWLKIVSPTKLTKNKKGKNVKSGGGHKLVYLDINCENKTFSTSDSVAYDKNGNVIGQDFANDFNERFKPGTVFESVYLYICTE